MPAIKCLSPQVRDILIEVLEDLEVEPATIEALRGMDACENAAIEYETASHQTPTREAPTPPTTRKKRPASAYQQHTGECMKGGHKTMSECAALWRAKKGK